MWLLFCHSSGAPGEFPSDPGCLIVWTHTHTHSLDTHTHPSTLGRGPQLSAFAENFSGIYCSLLPPGCWSADSQRVVFDSAQRSRQVRSPDCVERQPSTNPQELWAWDIAHTHCQVDRPAHRSPWPLKALPAPVLDSFFLEGAGCPGTPQQSPWPFLLRQRCKAPTLSISMWWARGLPLGRAPEHHTGS